MIYNETRNVSAHHEEVADRLIMFKYQQYTLLSIIPVGTILNCLCLYIIIKSGIYKSGTGIHLLFIAIADNVVILSSMFTDSSNTSRVFLPLLFNNKVISCEFTFFTMLTGFLWSGLLLTSATCQRFLSVAFPLKMKTWNLYEKSKILMGVYIIASFGLNSLFLICLKSVKIEDGNWRCFPVSKFQTLCRYNDIIVSTVLSNCLCSFLIFVFTILTSIFLFKQAKKRSHMLKDSDSSKEFQISLMLITVATLFLVLRLPEIVMFQVVSFFAGNSFQKSVPQILVDIYPFLWVPVELNHSINFFIYLIFLKSFRQQCIRLLPSCLRCRFVRTSGSDTGSRVLQSETTSCSSTQIVNRTKK